MSGWGEGHEGACMVVIGSCFHGGGSFQMNRVKPCLVDIACVYDKVYSTQLAGGILQVLRETGNAPFFVGQEQHARSIQGRGDAIDSSINSRRLTSCTVMNVLGVRIYDIPGTRYYILYVCYRIISWRLSTRCCSIYLSTLF